MKTRDLLQSLARGEEPSTPFMAAAQVRYLRANLEFIRFYDSWYRCFGEIHDDALAVIRKREAETLPLDHP